MPHFTVEYSANLEPDVDIGGLLNAVHAAAIETGIFPLGGLRVRAIRCEHYRIADLAAENGFIDMTLRLGDGRDFATRKRAGALVFSAMVNYLEPELARRSLAVSFEVREIYSELSFRKNTIHDRLKAAKG